MSGQKDVNAMRYNPSANAPPHIEGAVFYDSVERTLALFNDRSGVRHQLGQEHLIRVFNNSGSAIPKSSAVYVTGSEGSEFRPTIALARSDDETTAQLLGITTHTIPDNEFGYVTEYGVLRGFDTSALAAGQLVYLSPTISGGLQTTKPGFGNFVVIAGFALRIDAVDGSMYVSPFIDVGGIVGAQPFSFDTLLFDQPNPFMSTNSATYVAGAEFIFNGTSVLTQPPNKATLVVGAGQDGSDSGFRLFDVTNGLTIAEVSSTPTDQTRKILDMGTLSNLPTGPVIMEIQFRKNSGGTAVMSFFRFFRG